MIVNDSLIRPRLYCVEDKESLSSGVPTMQLQPRNRSRRRDAFTLMEVLVVVAILVVLAGIGVVVFRYLDDSKERIAKVQIKTLETVINSFKITDASGDFPPNLDVLTQPLDGKPAFLDPEKLIDPWQRPYQYDPNTRNPRTGIPLIYSQGINQGNPAGYIRNWNE
jgi:general secretion pathway protein G